MTSETATDAPREGLARAPWQKRHLLVLTIVAVGVFAFLVTRLQWHPMHHWNRAFGDMSLLLIAASMAIGPLARLWPAFRGGVPWRREFGIYGVLLAIAHTIVILVGWVEWDLIRLFGFEIHPGTGLYAMASQGFGLANAIGIVALIYGIVLALASNDWSQRRLGGPVWKFLQQGAYVLWMLAIVHTAYFLYMHFLDFNNTVHDPNWAQLPFVGLVLAVMLLQFAAFVKTWRGKQKTRPAAQQA